MAEILDSGNVQFHQVDKPRGSTPEQRCDNVIDNLAALALRLDGERRDLVWPPLEVRTDGVDGYVIPSVPQVKVADV